MFLLVCKIYCTVFRETTSCLIGTRGTRVTEREMSADREKRGFYPVMCCVSTCDNVVICDTVTINNLKNLLG